MAAEGARLTNFYSTAPNCTPSRTALNTGRYQFRSGLTNVLNPDSRIGIADSELTLGEAFKQAGYATAWSASGISATRPRISIPCGAASTEYFGHSLQQRHAARAAHRRRGGCRVPGQQATLTKRYTEAGDWTFIERNKEKPFFLYFAHAMPHKPLAASEEFYKKSGAGLYGDVISELDCQRRPASRQAERAGPRRAIRW